MCNYEQNGVHWEFYITSIFLYIAVKMINARGYTCKNCVNIPEKCLFIGNNVND